MAYIKKDKRPFCNKAIQENGSVNCWHCGDYCANGRETLLGGYTCPTCMKKYHLEQFGTDYKASHLKPIHKFLYSADAFDRFYTALNYVKQFGLVGEPLIVLSYGREFRLRYNIASNDGKDFVEIVVEKLVGSYKGYTSTVTVYVYKDENCLFGDSLQNYGIAYSVQKNLKLVKPYNSEYCSPYVKMAHDMVHFKDVDGLYMRIAPYLNYSWLEECCSTPTELTLMRIIYGLDQTPAAQSIADAARTMGITSKEAYKIRKTVLARLGMGKRYRAMLKESESDRFLRAKKPTVVVRASEDVFNSLYGKSQATISRLIPQIVKEMNEVEAMKLIEHLKKEIKMAYADKNTQDYIKMAEPNWVVEVNELFNSIVKSVRGQKYSSVWKEERNDFTNQLKKMGLLQYMIEILKEIKRDYKVTGRPEFIFAYKNTVNKYQLEHIYAVRFPVACDVSERNKFLTITPIAERTSDKYGTALFKIETTWDEMKTYEDDNIVTSNELLHKGKYTVFFTDFSTNLESGKRIYEDTSLDKNVRMCDLLTIDEKYAKYIEEAMLNARFGNRFMIPAINKVLKNGKFTPDDTNMLLGLEVMRDYIDIVAEGR